MPAITLFVTTSRSDSNAISSILDPLLDSVSHGISSWSHVVLPRKGGGAHVPISDDDGGADDDDSASSTSSSVKGLTSSEQSEEESETFSVASWNQNTASPYSPGDSTISTIQPGSSVYFVGRQIGGGTRTQVYGTSVYGSGYPYGLYGTYVAGRPLPFGFWPVYWGDNYYGGEEYGPAHNSSRPGGEQVTYALLLTNNNSSSPASTFYLIGDVQSASYIASALTTNCSLAAPTNVSDGTIQPSQVVQYYRASSFALALASYNFTPASQSYDPLVNTSLVDSSSYYEISTPPITGVNMSLLACVNATIGAALPLLDAGGGGSGGGLSTVAILWIVVGSIEFVLALFIALRCCCCNCSRKQKF